MTGPRLRSSRLSLARTLATLVAVGAAGLVGCGSDGSDSGPSGQGGGASIELYPNAKVLDSGTLALVTSAAGDLATLTFGSTNAVLDGLVAGDVILGGISPNTPYGVLRRVQSATKSGGGLVVATERASITDAIRRGTIVIPTTTLTRAGATVEAASGTRIQSVAGGAMLSGPSLKTQGTAAADLSRDFTLGVDDFTIVPGVTAGASLGFGLGVDLALTIDEKKLEGRAILKGSESASINVKALVSQTLDERVPVGKVTFAPVPVTIAGVPLVLVTSLGLEVGVEGEASASAKWSAKQDGKVDVGLIVSTSDGVKPVLDGATSGQIDPVTVEGSANLKAYAGLTLNIALSALVADASFRMGADGYVSLEASTTSIPCFDAKAGVRGRVGVNASVLGITLADAEKKEDVLTVPISKGDCAKGPSIAVDGFAMAFGRTDYELAPALDVLADDSILVGCNSSGIVGYVTRLAPDGTTVWERKIDGAVGVSRIEGLGGGKVFVGGKSGGVPVVGAIKPNVTRGDVREIRATGASLSSFVSTATKDGGILGGGIALQGSDYVPYAVKIDGTGAVAWAKTYSAELGEPHAVAETSDGGFVFVGEYKKNPTVNTMVLRLNGAGEPVYARTYGDGRLYGVTGLAGGGIAAVGQTATGSGAVVFKTASDGALDWGFSYENDGAGSVDFRGNAVVERADGFVVGGKRDFGASADAWLLAVGKDGALGFSRTYGGSDADDFQSVQPTKDGSIVGVGETKSFGGTRLFLVRVPSSGAIAFAGGSGAVQKNVSGVSKPMPGSGASLSATSKPLTIALNPVAERDWALLPTTSTRTKLTP